MTLGATIDLHEVTKHHPTEAGLVPALAGVTLHVAPGERVAITGPSGCGKSTLLGLIAGLDTPSEGRVAIDGVELSSMSDDERADLRRHEIGMIFQADNLLPFLTATENVSLQLSLADREGAHARSTDLLAHLGLSQEAGKLPDELSGGQRQRVAVARALVHHPSLLVADEPTGSLDMANAMGVIDLLVDATRATGATLLVVTHEPEVGARLDRTIGLRDGRLT